MNRDRFNQLPSSAELKDVLAAETKRSMPKEKEQSHYFDFSSAIELAKHFGTGSDVLEKSYTPQDIDTEDLFAKGKTLTEEIKANLLDRDLSADDIALCNKAYDYLAEEDALEAADLIFVFGAKTPLRIEKAIELFTRGWSARMVVSGRSPHYANGESRTEAETYAAVAAERGIPGTAIIIENESITVPDNVRSSLNLLEAKGIGFNSMILVNSPYTQRRGWAHFKKYLPDSVKLFRINSGTGEQYARENWYKNAAGIDTVLSEYIKAKVAVSLNTA